MYEYWICLLCGKRYRRPLGCIADLRCACDPRESGSFSIKYGDEQTEMTFPPNATGEAALPAKEDA